MSDEAIGVLQALIGTFAEGDVRLALPRGGLVTVDRNAPVCFDQFVLKSRNRFKSLQQNIFLTDVSSNEKQ